MAASYIIIGTTFFAVSCTSLIGIWLAGFDGPSSFIWETVLIVFVFLFFGAMGLYFLWDGILSLKQVRAILRRLRREAA